MMISGKKSAAGLGVIDTIYVKNIFGGVIVYIAFTIGKTKLEREEIGENRRIQTDG